MSDIESDNMDSSLAELDQDDNVNQLKDKNFSDDDDLSSDDSNSSDSESEKNQEQKDKKQLLAEELKKRFTKEKDVGYGEHLIGNEDTQEKPPLVVVVQGPKKSGKTTLIKSLVKHFTKHKLQSVNGNITVRVGKNQRVTFIECPNEINAMIDLAKVADLALILIDVSIGFELETFEFISLLRSSGFPNVMGIQTHMDFFKDNKQLRKTKKRYKKRFEHEVGSDYKLFYLQGIQNDGLYPKRDILNLARYLQIIKYASVPWKQNHPYIVPDSWENNDQGAQVTPDEQEVSVSFYGYVRGCSYRTNSRVHVIGLGDYDINKVEILDDPCPNMHKEDKDLLKINNSDDENSDEGGDDQDSGNEGGEDDKKGDAALDQTSSKPKKNRTLKQKERIVFAPYSNLGFLSYEKAGGYITIPDKYVYYTRKDKIENLDQDQKEIQEENEEEDDDSEKEGDDKQDLEGVKLMRDLQDLQQGIDEQDDGETLLLPGVQIKDKNENNNNSNKQNNNLNQSQAFQQEEQEFKDEAQRAFNQKQREIMNLKHKTQNIQKLKHAQTITDNMLATDLHDLIYGNNESVSNYDCSRFSQKGLLSRQMYKLAIKKQFMAGSGYGEDVDFGDSDEEEEGKDGDKKKTKKQVQDEEDAKREEEEAKKRQESLNIDNFIDSDMGIYKKGLYIKMDLKIKFKHYKQFSPENPLILCRINPGEDTFGFVKARFKKHRWYGNLLKSRDPLIFSIGWRRYQSIPVYCTEDQDLRTRYLKYTPQHEYCTAIFYGNFAPQNTGIVCTQSLNNKLEKFRISGTGQVVELNHTFDVMKKLKLIGEPFKIYKNSAFVKGMFNSAMEVSKFEGASIKTVSGIRGQIKKSIKEGGEGCYRATFEDKVVKSDLIFLRTWFKMPLQKFYNPIVSYERMRLMKTTWELRKQNGIKLEQKKDSEYKEIERPEQRHFKKLQVSKNLQENLPFKTQEKVKKFSKKELLEKKEATLPIKSLTSDKEKEAYALIQRLNTIRNEKVKLKESRQKEKTRIKSAQKTGEMQKFQGERKERDKKRTKDKYTKAAKKVKAD